MYFALCRIWAGITTISLHRARKVCTADLKLDHDLVCTGHGITVGAERIKIKLKGHSIMGPGNVGGNIFTGIRVGGRTDVSVEGPGTVTGFFVGIGISNSQDVRVQKVDVVANGGSVFGDGIRVFGSTDVEIKHNLISGTRGDGVDAALSADVEIEKNRIQGNGVGVRIFRALTENEIEKSENSGSESIGIVIQASTGVEVEKNLISDSGRFGAFLLLATGNTFEKNTFVGNGADFC